LIEILHILIKRSRICTQNKWRRSRRM